MSRQIESLDKYMHDMMIDILSDLDINSRNASLNINKALHDIMYTIRSNIRYKLINKEIKVIDAFNKELTIDTEYYEDFLSSENINEIITTKLNNPDIPLEEVLRFSNKRFCALYSKNDNKIITVDMPIDIFKFLYKKGYDDTFIIDIANGHYSMQYKFVDIIKKALKIGVHFNSKQIALGSKSINMLNDITQKLNPVESFDIMYKAQNTNIKNKFIKIGMQKDIHVLTLVYRVLFEDMPTADAIKIGIEERQNYGINHNFDTNSNKLIKEAAYKIIRDYMKEQEVNEINR